MAGVSHIIVPMSSIHQHQTLRRPQSIQLVNEYIVINNGTNNLNTKTQDLSPHARTAKQCSMSI